MWASRPVVSLGAVFVLLEIGSHLGVGSEIQLRELAPDPHGTPRPVRHATHVPLKTSLYFELRLLSPSKADLIEPDSVAIRLVSDSTVKELLNPGHKYGRGATGWLRPTKNLQGETALAVYIEPGEALNASTNYRVEVSARSRDGVGMAKGHGGWDFRTEDPPGLRPLPLSLDLNTVPVAWHGAFFSGFGNVCFCTDEATFGPTYELMAEARKEHPNAWSLQRDFWMTGTEFRPAGLLPQRLPNLVRERETRRIVAIQGDPHGTLLHLEAPLGNEQYGVAKDRRLADDFQPGDEVLVADGVHDRTVKVLATNDAAGTLVVTLLEDPPGGWKTEYEGPLPSREDRDAPGLFPAGGCYLRKLRPAGTPIYYWGRLDKEWDLARRRYGRRLLPNFADAAGDLARDGRSWTTAKNPREWHEVARAITLHLIDRYGPDARTFVWSVFNEPDLGPLFWRADWDELQRFYDYTVDAILRAFEDRGLDSDGVFVGGLELGGIFGVHLRLEEFLAHCSPVATAKGALPLNAAFADRLLDGKRSRRVEALCRAHGGKGTPCDFVSIHAYNRSDMMAAKLIHAKEIALGIDPVFYEKLWINSHESCPDWMPPPDEAAADSYLGNGYFPTWCADVARRQLARAAADRRFAYGESILTVWPPNKNFAGMNAVTRVLHADDDGDGKTDRQVTIPMPIFHVLNLLSDMGRSYWVLEDRELGGHHVTGFASRDPKAVRILLYAQHPGDTQARSESEFEVGLDVSGLGWRRARVREYRFDKDHNSYFRIGRELRDRSTVSEMDPGEVAEAVRRLEGDDPATQEEAIRRLERKGRGARPALSALFGYVGKVRDDRLRSLAMNCLIRVAAEESYTPAEVERVRELSTCRPSATSRVTVVETGPTTLKLRVAAGGLNFLVLEEDQAPP